MHKYCISSFFFCVHEENCWCNMLIQFQPQQCLRHQGKGTESMLCFSTLRKKSNLHDLIKIAQNVVLWMFLQHLVCTNWLSTTLSCTQMFTHIYSFTVAEWNAYKTNLRHCRLPQHPCRTSSSYWCAECAFSPCQLHSTLHWNKTNEMLSATEQSKLST